MVKFKIEIPEVPRRELDSLDKILSQLFSQIDWVEMAGNKLSEEGKKPFANFRFVYGLNDQNKVEVDADGISLDGNFKTTISLNLSDQSYTQLESVLILESSYVGKILEQTAKSKIKY